jgi:hypothetical protein
MIRLDTRYQPDMQSPHETSSRTEVLPHMSEIWFITGSSRGFGRQFTQAALERGDKVAATARNTDSLADLVATHGEARRARLADGKIRTIPGPAAPTSHTGPRFTQASDA